MLDASNIPSGAHTQAKRRRWKAPVRDRLARRLGELGRLARFREQYRVAFGDSAAWAFLLAEICLFLRNHRDLPSFHALAEHVLGETGFIIDDKTALPCTASSNSLAGAVGCTGPPAWSPLANAST